MKKYFLLAAAAATVLAVSCNKEKNQPTTDPTPQIEDNTPQPIRFGTNIAEVKAPITKSAIEDHGWDGTQNLYIYGLEFDGTNLLLSSDGAETPTYAPYINEVKAASPSAPATGTRDAIEVYKTYTSDTDYTYYYYAGTKVYNFYAYYVGDAKMGTDMQNLEDAAGKATETSANNIVSSIAIENLVIDGKNDIMIATTDKMADYAVVDPAPTVSLDKIYSATSARQGVVPDLVFQHQLSRFVFQTTYGGANNASYATNRAKVKINSLKLKSPYKGTLTVYGQTPGFAAVMDDETAFTLEGIDANGVNPGTDTYGQYAPLGDIGANKTASILAVPKGNEQTVAKYDLILNVSQDNGNNNVATQDVPLEIDFSKLENATKTYAEAGKQYLVKIVVYGLEEIRVTVSLEEWGEGGDTTIDPDNNDPRPVPVFNFTTPADPTANLDLTVGTPSTIEVTAAYGTTSAEITAIKYGTTNKKIATVSDAGVITPVAVGTCKIYVYVEATDDYQGAMQAITVNVAGAPDLAPTVTASIVDTQTTPAALSTWTFTQATENTAVGTISGSATVGGNAVAAGTWTYEVEDNPYFTVDNTGAIKTKDLTSASAPTTNDLVVTFTAHLAASVGNYSAGQATATITVPHN